ncbi:hypothetical protein [Pseudoalteromonas gelatinilytica]
MIKYNLVQLISREVLHEFTSSCTKVTKQEIEDADGRKKSTSISKTGSYLYIVFENKTPLYVGETSESLKRRFISDTDGSHKKRNSIWYQRMTHVCFLNLTEGDSAYRKLLEQALSIAIEPKFYG